MVGTYSGELSVIVLNWNGAEDTLACLQSLAASTIPVHTVVVDNNSADDSVARIQASGLADAIITSEVNLGFAEGNNVGLVQALADGAEFIAVLNNDTVVSPDALESLLAALRAAAPAQIAVSADLRYFDEPGRSWFDGGIIDGCWPRHRQPGEPRGTTVRLGPADAVTTELLTGCCIAAHRGVWERVGLFDAGYFLIFEDTDWSLRATAAGVGLLVVRSSTILHRVSRTMGAGPPARLSGFYFMRNGLRLQARLPAPGHLAFLWRFLLRPGPRLILSGDGDALLFRCLGALAWMLGDRGPAPRVVQTMARRRIFNRVSENRR